jgi:hemerythrin-like domain-containing protein
MADRVLRDRERTELESAFERIAREEAGEGVHERYLGLAESLEREVGE